MCLISVCPKGTNKYSQEVTDFIRVGVASNRSGSGFMYKKDGDSFIYVKKGFWTFEELHQSIKDANLKDNDELVIHHRIGTSGRETKENMHPFVISQNHEDLIMLSGKIDKPALVHNGFFNNIDHFENKNPDFSDTYAMTRYIMPHVIDLYTYETPTFEKVFSSIIGGSKICVLYPNRDLVMAGKFVEENGYYHSHSGFRNMFYRDRGGVRETDWSGFSQGTTTKRAALTESPKLLLAPAVKSDKKETIRLDGNIIDINEFNYHHFVYQLKDSSSTRAWRFDSYDSKAALNTLYCQNENYRSIDPVDELSLHSDYHFYPKKEFEGYYREYKVVLEKLTASKNMLKDIYKILQKNKYKHIANTFKIKKLQVSKCSLVNIYMSLSKNYMANDSFYSKLGVHQITSLLIVDTMEPLNKPEKFSNVGTFPIVSKHPEVMAQEEVQNVSCGC